MNKKESKVEIEKLEHGYHVTFTILDVETELLKITLYVADERQIEIVKENFFNNAVGIYPTGILIVGGDVLDAPCNRTRGIISFEETERAV